MAHAKALENLKKGKATQFKKGHPPTKGSGRPKSAFIGDLAKALGRKNAHLEGCSYSAEDFSRLRRWILSAPMKDVEKVLHNKEKSGEISVAILAVCRAMYAEMQKGDYKLNLTLQEFEFGRPVPQQLDVTTGGESFNKPFETDKDTEEWLKRRFHVT